MPEFLPHIQWPKADFFGKNETRVPRTLDKAYNAKYQMAHPPPIWVVNPTTVIAWTEFPKDATRFRL